MRNSSKILAILFLVVAAGLVYWTTRADETEIQAQVEERLVEAATKQEAEAEQRVRERLAALDSAIVLSQQPVFARLTADHFEEVLRRMGVAYTREVDEGGDPRFSVKLATYDVTLYSYSCDEAGCATWRLAVCFVLDEKPSLEAINTWNNTKRFSTAFRSDTGDACLDTDLIARGGVTIGAIEAFLLNFRDRLGEFTSHIGY